MVVVGDVLSGLLIFVFTGGGVGKLARFRQQVATAERLQVPWPRYRLIAIPELAAAIGLAAGLFITPLGVAAAIGLAALMAGAIAMRLRVHDAAPFIVGDSVILALAVATAVAQAAAG